LISEICQSLLPLLINEIFEETEDRETHQEIYLNLLQDFLRHVNSLGFCPFQFCVAVSMIKAIHDNTMELIHARSFDLNSWSEMALRILNECPAQDSKKVLFTKHEIESIISYLTIGYVQHMHLYDYVYTHRQEYQVFQTKKIIEFQTVPFEPLNGAIKAEKWQEYCKAEEDKREAERQKAADAENKRRLEEKALAEQQARERHTAMLKQQVGIIYLSS
jgi:hypothetical protein